MITKIIHIADIHIKNLRRRDEYQEQLQKFIDQCIEITNENGAENTRIVIAGDLLHNKLDISGEGYTLAAWFLRQLDDLCKVIVIAGNHDMNMSNLTRIDPISTIFSLCNFNQTYYLDMELDYESGCMSDDNIVWCLYSCFDSFNKPNIDGERINNPNKTFVGLFHGEIKGSSTDAGYKSENGLMASYFDGLDMCLMGHIHKRQEIKYNGIPLVYCGSLIQQDHGENISGHGYVVWNVDELTWEPVDIPNEGRGFYTFKITNEDDIDDNKEELINL